MDPNNQPWTPRPYEPEAPDQPTSSQPQQPADMPRPVTPWQPDAAPTPQAPPVQQQPQFPTPPLPPVQQQPHQPQPFWQNPQQQPAQSTQAPQQPQSMSTQPFGNPQQYGAPMAELPPLAEQSTYTPAEKKQRLVMWLVVAVAVILPAFLIGLMFWGKTSDDHTKQKQQQAAAQVSYNADAIAQLAKTPTDAQAAKLDKNATFYTVLKAAAKQPIVNTKWDVYYTAAQDGKRTDQYTFYDTTIDYKTKSYAYNENSYSNLGVFQTRCIGDKQYNFNDSKLTSGPTWQQASDSTDCALSTVMMHLNDGLNTGGLDDKQSDAFMSKLQQSGVVKVNSVSIADNKGKKYLKVDANVVPQRQGNGDIYWGVQRFMSAFQATGLDANKHPYTFFGASGEGAHVAYYVDPATQLPVYSVIESTPSYDKFGKPQVTTNWSHRFIEYAYPQAVTAPTLNDHKPIGFTAWPDH